MYKKGDVLIYCGNKKSVLYGERVIFQRSDGFKIWIRTENDKNRYGLMWSFPEDFYPVIEEEE